MIVSQLQRLKIKLSTRVKNCIKCISISRVEDTLGTLLEDLQLRIGVYFADLTCAIDVGASYYPHPAWKLIRLAPNALWIAVDPNSENLDYLTKWQESYVCNLTHIPFGLNSHDGEATLYITNIDSGSSLLPVKVSPDWGERVDHNYFYPITTKKVECITLQKLISQSPISTNTPIWVKLDTQGTEFAILRSLEPEKFESQLLLVETECTLQRIPLMAGSGKLPELIEFMERKGFEIIYFKPIPSRHSIKTSMITDGVLNECDIVFALSPMKAINERSLIHNLSLISAYLCYGIIGEAALHAKRILANGKFKIDNSSRLLLEELESLLLS